MLLKQQILKMRDNTFRSAESNQGDQAFCHRSPSGVRRHALYITIEFFQLPNFIMTYWLHVVVCVIKMWPNMQFCWNARFLHSVHRPDILNMKCWEERKPYLKFLNFKHYSLDDGMKNALNAFVCNYLRCMIDFLFYKT